MKRNFTQFSKTFAAVLCVCVLAFSIYQFTAGEKVYAEGNVLYEEVQDTAQVGYRTVSVELPGEASEPIEIPDIDFEALTAVNVEGLAWIYLPDSRINYPVAQGEDNKYYLNHLIDGRRNSNGTIFLDYRNSPDFSDRNNALYGHRMKSGAMFAGIEKYKQQSYYDDHPYMYLVTKDACYRVDLFAGIVKDASDIALAFSSDQAFLDYIEELRARSTFESPVQVGAGDRLLTMSTCARDFKNARYTLIGKLTQVW